MNHQSEIGSHHEKPYDQRMNPHHEKSNNKEMNMQSREHTSHSKQMYETCKKFHLYFVQIQTTEGQLYDGIIEDVDNEGVAMLVPSGDIEQGEGMERQFGYGYGGYGFPRRFRRFRRVRFPFFQLHRLFFPYYYPYYY